MTWTYTTQQGDTWDVLAHDIYGSEYLAYIIIMANPNYMKYVYFPAGIKLTIPQTPRVKKDSNPKPPWAVY